MTLADRAVEPTLSGLPSDRPLVVVTVGSDHHPFDRLVGWVDTWLGSGAADHVDCVVQYGTAQPPRHGTAVAYLDHGELQRLMAAASAVVVQGGPMSIVESRRLGKRPVVVPRTASLGEVVDDHQHAFCTRLADQGRIEVVADAASLARAVDAALADPASVEVGADPEHDAAVARSVATFGRVVGEVLDQRLAGQDILMLGGFGRSGSTLLERMLGEVPGVTALGEVLHLWERGLRDDERCGCGLPFWECPFWTAVGARAFGGWTDIPVDQAVDDRLDVVRNRHVPSLVVPVQPVGRRLRRDRLLRRLHALYSAAAEVGAARLLVDSSKHPAYAFLLRRSAQRLRCVLVVRDPRGVAWSWGKTVLRPEIVGEDVHMPRYGFGASAMNWSAYGLLFHALSLLGVPVLTVRYEDLVSQPRETLARVLRFAGIEATAADLAHVHGQEVHLSAHHTVAGNPMRFTTGPLSLRLDEVWRTTMPARARRLVSLVTAPQRRLYGYSGDALRSRAHAR